VIEIAIFKTYSGTVMALKRTRLGQLNELDKKTKVTRDIEHLRKLKGHSNIITLYGSFEMCGEAYICMEKMETCFAKILQICVKKDIFIPTKVLATLCYSISNALVFLKEKKIIHRDVKPGTF
jgi:serine/threonine protein kinase